MGYGLRSLEENEKTWKLLEKKVKFLDKVCQILNICPYKWPNSNKIAIIVVLSNLFLTKST
jgi:SET domain-containing protein